MADDIWDVSVDIDQGTVNAGPYIENLDMDGVSRMSRRLSPEENTQFAAQIEEGTNYLTEQRAELGRSMAMLQQAETNLAPLRQQNELQYRMELMGIHKAQADLKAHDTAFENQQKSWNDLVSHVNDETDNTFTRVGRDLGKVLASGLAFVGIDPLDSFRSSGYFTGRFIEGNRVDEIAARTGLTTIIGSEKYKEMGGPSSDVEAFFLEGAFYGYTRETAQLGTQLWQEGEYEASLLAFGRIGLTREMARENERIQEIGREGQEETTAGRVAGLVGEIIPGLIMPLSVEAKPITLLGELTGATKGLQAAGQATGATKALTGLSKLAEGRGMMKAGATVAGAAVGATMVEGDAADKIRGGLAGAMGGMALGHAGAAATGFLRGVADQKRAAQSIMEGVGGAGAVDRGAAHMAARQAGMGPRAVANATTGDTGSMNAAAFGSLDAQRSAGLRDAIGRATDEVIRELHPDEDLITLSKKDARKVRVEAKKRLSEINPRYAASDAVIQREWHRGRHGDLAAAADPAGILTPMSADIEASIKTYSDMRDSYVKTVAANNELTANATEQVQILKRNGMKFDIPDHEVAETIVHFMREQGGNSPSAAVESMIGPGATFQQATEVVPMVGVTEGTIMRLKPIRKSGRKINNVVILGRAGTDDRGPLWQVANVVNGEEMLVAQSDLMAPLDQSMIARVNEVMAARIGVLTEKPELKTYDLFEEAGRASHVKQAIPAGEGQHWRKRTGNDTPTGEQYQLINLNDGSVALEVDFNRGMGGEGGGGWNVRGGGSMSGLMPDLATAIRLQKTGAASLAEAAKPKLTKHQKALKAELRDPETVAAESAKVDLALETASEAVKGEGYRARIKRLVGDNPVVLKDLRRRMYSEWEWMQTSPKWSELIDDDPELMAIARGMMFHEDRAPEYVAQFILDENTHLQGRGAGKLHSEGSSLSGLAFARVADGVEAFLKADPKRMNDLTLKQRIAFANESTLLKAAGKGNDDMILALRTASLPSYLGAIDDMPVFRNEGELDEWITANMARWQRSGIEESKAKQWEADLRRDAVITNESMQAAEEGMRPEAVAGRDTPVAESKISESGQRESEVNVGTSGTGGSGTDVAKSTVETGNEAFQLLAEKIVRLEDLGWSKAEADSGTTMEVLTSPNYNKIFNEIKTRGLRYSPQLLTDLKQRFGLDRKNVAREYYLKIAEGWHRRRFVSDENYAALTRSKNPKKYLHNPDAQKHADFQAGLTLAFLDTGQVRFDALIKFMAKDAKTVSTKIIDRNFNAFRRDILRFTEQQLNRNPDIGDKPLADLLTRWVGEQRGRMGLPESVDITISPERAADLVTSMRSDLRAAALASRAAPGSLDAAIVRGEYAEISTRVDEISDRGNIEDTIAFMPTERDPKTGAPPIDVGAPPRKPLSKTQAKKMTLTASVALLDRVGTAEHKALAKEMKILKKKSASPKLTEADDETVMEFINEYQRVQAKVESEAKKLAEEVRIAEEGATGKPGVGALAGAGLGGGGAATNEEEDSDLLWMVGGLMVAAGIYKGPAMLRFLRAKFSSREMGEEVLAAAGSRGRNIASSRPGVESTEVLQNSGFTSRLTPRTVANARNPYPLRNRNLPFVVKSSSVTELPNHTITTQKSVMTPEDARSLLDPETVDKALHDLTIEMQRHGVTPRGGMHEGLYGIDIDGTAKVVLPEGLDVMPMWQHSTADGLTSPVTGRATYVEFSGHPDVDLTKVPLRVSERGEGMAREFLSGLDEGSQAVTQSNIDALATVADGTRQSAFIRHNLTDPPQGRVLVGGVEMAARKHRSGVLEISLAKVADDLDTVARAKSHGLTDDAIEELQAKDLLESMFGVDPDLVAQSISRMPLANRSSDSQEAWEQVNEIRMAAAQGTRAQRDMVAQINRGMENGEQVLDRMSQNIKRNLTDNQVRQLKMVGDLATHKDPAVAAQAQEVIAEMTRGQVPEFGAQTFGDLILSIKRNSTGEMAQVMGQVDEARTIMGTFGRTMIDATRRVTKSFAGDPEGERRIIQALESDEYGRLSDSEKMAAMYVRHQFDQALELQNQTRTALGMPVIERIEGYFTHIFDNNGETWGRLPGTHKLDKLSVKNYFSKKRLGLEGYKMDLTEVVCLPSYCSQ
jgi:hypothetical protein